MGTQTLTPQERADAIVDRTHCHDMVATDKLHAAILATVTDAVAAEREACAQVADAIDDSVAEAIAERIRKRT